MSHDLTATLALLRAVFFLTGGLDVRHDAFDLVAAHDLTTRRHELTLPGWHQGLGLRHRCALVGIVAERVQVEHTDGAFTLRLLETALSLQGALVCLTLTSVRPLTVRRAVSGSKLAFVAGIEHI